MTAEIAQLGERQTEDLKVPGSNPENSQEFWIIPGLGIFFSFFGNWHKLVKELFITITLTSISQFKLLFLFCSFLVLADSPVVRIFILWVFLGWIRCGCRGFGRTPSIQKRKWCVITRSFALRMPEISIPWTSILNIFRAKMPLDPPPPLTEVHSRRSLCRAPYCKILLLPQIFAFMKEWVWVESRKGLR